MVPGAAEAPSTVAAECNGDEEQVCAVQDGGFDDTVVDGCGATAGEEEAGEAATTVPEVHVHGL